ncbi:SWIM zinc finger family protein [Gordonia sp. HY285]|uniref:SWIM zinc finger family protein n=1 Tax=Gordonia liuliyuniae TaxID=2911517 RepID=UPI001F4397B1|nr:SWIM zinc finger family protein [Gordonia liuliyuniae]MCF8611144.1 SWIM zinc finger family protein [Gordonia liuliyuniae]
MATDFGFTTWGADIVRIAEPITATVPNASAPSARRIARNNGVTLEIDGRQVTARVHRGGEASVARLEIAAMESAVVVALREEMGSRTEPDDTVHAALRARGLRPAAALEAADCSCRARKTMCVHVLAALYALAALVDHAPSTVLGMQSGQGSADDADTDAVDGPPPRWTPIAALSVRDYYVAER